MFVLHDVLPKIILFAMILAIGVGLIQFRKLDKTNKILLVCVFFHCLIDRVHFLIRTESPETISFLFRLYTLGEFFILFYLASSLLKIPKTTQIFTYLAACGLIAFNIYIGADYNGYFKAFSSIVIAILFAIILIRKLTQDSGIGEINYTFIVIFLYYIVSSLIFIFINQLHSLSRINAILLWSVNNILALIFYISLTINFLRHRNS